MKRNLISRVFKLHILLDEEGQDLVEYALVVALIGLTATAGMSSLATAINNAFGGIGSTLSTYVS
jgi:pilus assembly protein Flp/PilA